MRVLICGAGIAGLSAAQRFSALGWDVVVIEKAPGPRAHGYLIDFWGLGYDAVERMGALPRLRELSYPITEWTYVDEAGRRRAGLDAAAFVRTQRGRLVTVLRQDIERAVREQLPDSVTIRYGQTIESIEQSGDEVSTVLSDGTEVRADLLVGADGIHSVVRELVFGPEQRFLRYLGFHMAAWLFEDAETHQRLGNRFCFTDTYHQQVALYSLRDNQVAAFAAHRCADPAIPDNARLAVRQAYGSLGWLIPLALEKCPPDNEIYYDQMAQIEIDQWSRGRVVLLGDACGAVSPLASQGASLAVAGAYLLARQLETAESVADALGTYQRLWQPIITARQRGARRGAQWFLPDSPSMLRVRRIGMHLAALPGVSSLITTGLGARQGPNIDQLSVQTS